MGKRGGGRSHSQSAALRSAGLPAPHRPPRRGVPGAPLCVCVCPCVRLCVLGERLLTCLGTWGCWVSSERDQREWLRWLWCGVSARGSCWVCLAWLCLPCLCPVPRWARLSRPGLRECFTLVPGLRMAVLVCLRAERVAAVSRPCVALLAFLGVLCHRAMGLSA